MIQLIKSIVKYLGNFILDILAFIAAAFGGLPTKRFDDDGPANSGSDLIGKLVLVSEDVTESSGKVRYSGINCNAVLSKASNTTNLAAGEMALIVDTSGNTFVVTSSKSSV